MSLEITIRENHPDSAETHGYNYGIEGSLEELIRIVQTSLVGIGNNPFNRDSNPSIRSQLLIILEKLLKLKEKADGK